MRASTKKMIREYSLAIGIAIVAAFLIRFFVIEAYRIPTPAMRPTLEPGDTIFVAKWPFGLRIPGLSISLSKGRRPNRGEVVVFSFPTDPKRDFIKRVLGLPGDRVEIKHGQAFLNDQPLTEPMAKNAACGHERLPNGMRYSVCLEPPVLEDFPATIVPGDAVFVAGDLRTQGSGDTRRQKTWGMVPMSSLKGKALWIWLSIYPHVDGFANFRFERMFRSVR